MIRLFLRTPVQGVTLHRDMYLAADACDAMFILTEWEEFRHLDWSIISKMLHFPLIIDGRNMFSWEYMRQQAKEYNLIYLSVGRSPICAGEAVTESCPENQRHLFSSR
jgi:UDPglucose 6-dehydrogenase